MPVHASTGPVLGRCCQHRTSTGPVLANNGMFTGYWEPREDLRVCALYCVLELRGYRVGLRGFRYWEPREDLRACASYCVVIHILGAERGPQSVCLILCVDIKPVQNRVKGVQILGAMSGPESVCLGACTGSRERT